MPRGNSFVAEAPDSSLISREHLFSLQEQLCRRGTGSSFFTGTALSLRHWTAIFYGNSSVAEALDSSFFTGTALSQRHWTAIFLREQLCRRGTEQLLFCGNSSAAEEQLCRTAHLFRGNNFDRCRSTGQLAYFAGTALLQRHRIAHLFRGNTFFLYGNSSVAEALDSSFFTGTALSQRPGQLIYCTGTVLSQRHRAANLYCGNSTAAEAPGSSSISREELSRGGTGQLIYLAGGHRAAYLLRGNSSVAEAPDSSSISRGQACRRGQLICVSGTALSQRHRATYQFRGDRPVAGAPNSSYPSREQACRRGSEQPYHLFHGNSSVAEARTAYLFMGTALSQMHRTPYLFRGNSFVAEAPDSSLISREQLCHSG